LPSLKKPEPAIIEEHIDREPYVFQPTKPGIIVVVTTSAPNNKPHYGDFQQNASDLTPITFHGIIR
jgi:hypothetical protein